MKRTKFLIVLAVVGVLGIAGPVGAQPADEGLQGGFQMTVHTHSSRPETLLFPDVERLPFDFEEGDTFAYSSRLCSRNAPFNNLGLDFNPAYPGVDDDADGTASVRHQVAGTVTEVDGDTGTIEGTITTVLCEGGEATDNTIVTNFEATYRLVSDDRLEIRGTFEISPEDSTGTFADLEGQGSIEGSFTCLGDPVCADLGVFTDFVGARGDLSRGPGEIVPGLIGTFSDPTVETV